MTRVGKPTGLIRYSSRDLLEGHQRHIARPRTILYPLALAIFLGGFAYVLATRDAADVTEPGSGIQLPGPCGATQLRAPARLRLRIILRASCSTFELPCHVRGTGGT